MLKLYERLYLMNTNIRLLELRHWFWIFLTLLLLALLQPSFAETGLTPAYSGCENDERAPLTNGGDPRSRIERRHKVDPITERSFASVSLDELETVASETEDYNDLCWFRLDGVWRETGVITLDDEQDYEGWGSNSEDLLSLTHGNYTTLSHLFVQATDAPERSLLLSDGLTGAPGIEFISTDQIPLDQVLRRNGEAKTYYSSQPFIFPYGDTLTIDVSRSGRIRLALDNKTFIRPKPRVTKATVTDQIAADDAFLLERNLVNLSASRKGYNVVSQDPFFILQNAHHDVFAQASSKHYFISEQRTVPLGFSLIQEVAQGTVFRQSMVSSATEFQKMAASSFGAKVGDAGILANQSRVGYVGVSFAESSMNSMRESETVGQAIGYSRSKLYALIVDHPYITLSDDFIDAVDDARRYGKYQPLIEKFGTHYPYAVTYGAAAKMTQSFTEKSYTEIAETNESFGLEAGASAYGVAGTIDYKSSSGDRETESGTTKDNKATFVAVGGNGSWNENGYSAGNTPYPILLDLRPLPELLNPINFPDEPEIYRDVRAKLALEISDYLNGHNDLLSDASMLPKVTQKQPEPVEKWLVYVRQSWCQGHGFINTVKRIEGTMKAEVKTGGSYSQRKSKKLTTPCKKKDKGAKWKGNGQNLITLTGTRRELKRHVLQYQFDWRYIPSLNKHKTRSQRKKYKLPLDKNIGVGQRHDAIWVVKGKAKHPQLRIRLRFKRIE